MWSYSSIVLGREEMLKSSCKQLAPLLEHDMVGLLDIDFNWFITNCVAL